MDGYTISIIKMIPSCLVLSLWGQGDENYQSALHDYISTVVLLKTIWISIHIFVRFRTTGGKGDMDNIETTMVESRKESEDFLLPKENVFFSE